MLTTHLRTFVRSLFPLLFSLYLVPGALLHELADHQDECDSHVTTAAGTSVSSLHRHCELQQLGQPELFLPVFSSAHFWWPCTDLHTISVLITPPFTHSEKTFLRGPPTQLA